MGYKQAGIAGAAMSVGQGAHHLMRTGANEVLEACSAARQLCGALLL